MTDQNDPTSLGVARAPADVVAPIADPDSPSEGEATRPRDQLGGATDRDQDGQFSRRVTARIQGGEAIWSVVEVGPTFTEPPDPWLGASIVFEVTKSDGDTHTRVAHQGVAPEIQCHVSCSDTGTIFGGDCLHQVIATPEEMS